jgi:hypothetical protein
VSATRRRRLLAPPILVTVALALACAGAPSALAVSSSPSPWWAVSSAARPSNLQTGEPGQIVITAQNRGDASTGGEVTLVDELPTGLGATGIEGVAGGLGANRGPVECVLATLTCTFAGSLLPYEEIEVAISVSVQGATSGERNRASVSGGGVPGSVSASQTIEVDGSGGFGIEHYELIPENEGGSIDTQAGSHPFQLTSAITFDAGRPEPDGLPRTVALAKDVISELPAGLVATRSRVPQCTQEQFTAFAEPFNECPAQSAIGVATMIFNERSSFGLERVTVPIFNLEPATGEPARFGFQFSKLQAVLDTSIRSGGDYGVDVSALNISEAPWLLNLTLTFWGVPGDPRHDGQRGWQCLFESGPCPGGPSGTPAPVFTLPTSCGPFEATLHADSWGSSERQAEQAQPVSYLLPEAIDGCNDVPFAPSIELASDVSDASTPAGLNLDVRLPQGTTEDADALDESAIESVSVTLPEGVALNPSGTNGLEACSEEQAGLLGGGLLGARPPRPACPDASRIGTVKLKTPLLPAPLSGALYLATPELNPFGSLFAIYATTREPASGTMVALAGYATLNPLTGRITVTFQNMPQLPFEELEVHFFGGELAPLATPARCGTYRAQATFQPWSGSEAVGAQASIAITSAPNGAPCTETLPFAPSLTAGSTSVQAGAFSELSTTLSGVDGQQAPQSVRLQFPPGLSGLLSSVKLCPEAQADEGTCSEESLIGETSVSAGLGADPITVGGGKVYLTGPYQGAPFGLSISSPARAGPFDLEDSPESRPSCDCLVVRAKVEVNPNTAALTVITGPMPHIIAGVPLQIKHVNVTINRPNLVFNPTNCDPQSIIGTIESDEGALAHVTVPFQVANCKGLQLKPTLTASTRADGEFAGHGASLNITVATPASTAGTGEATAGQANLRSLRLTLPQRLPARLPTIQHACLQSTFDANPAHCPKAAQIGSATVHTPILSAPLAGPVYLVTKGSSSASPFPEMVLLLQAQGVNIDLSGGLYVSELNVTSVTFTSIPDLPITRLTLTLPEGKRSILAAGSNLCKAARESHALHLSGVFTGQDGATLKRSVKVSVSGCRHRRKHT